MKSSTKILTSILGLGILYSFIRMFTETGGSGLEDFLDALVYTSIILFLASLLIIIFNIPHLKKHGDTFLFLLLGLPMTIVFTIGVIQFNNYDKQPDLDPKYPRPLSQGQFVLDSLYIKKLIDSDVVEYNRKYGGPDIASTFIDTIFYSPSGDKIFVSYIKKFEANERGDDLTPDAWVGDSKDNGEWKFYDSRYRLGGTYHDTAIAKLEIRKLYFNQFSFLDKDSLSENYFWKQVLPSR